MEALEFQFPLKPVSFESCKGRCTMGVLCKISLYIPCTVPVGVDKYIYVCIERLEVWAPNMGPQAFLGGF